jgi:FMN-dependent NADH-azoreductase
LLQLKAKYAANQAQLEGWGLDTVAGTAGVVVRKPRTEKEWATFLTTYVTQETSLAAANQIANPPLAEMSTLATTLQTADAARKAGSSQRQAAVETRTAAANRLLDLLQAAALIIVVTQFNGVVTNNLQQWGFQVVTRTPTANGNSGQRQ